MIWGDVNLQNSRRKTMKVKIKKEKDYYLAYFIDPRRVIEVNKMGSVVLELLFNQQQKLDEIIENIAREYNKPLNKTREDVIDFLSQIKKEMRPGIFNVINQKQLESPLGVELEIITSCNLLCRHCLQKNHNGITMPTRQAIDIIDVLADNQVCEISLMGGEPLKHDGLIEILEHCQKRSMAVSFVTNGTLLNEQLIKKLANIARLVVLVSLDGTEKTHDYIRGKGVFKKMEENLRKMLAENIATETICTLNSVNISIYKEVADYCRELDIPCNFNLFKPFRPAQKKLILNPDIFFDAIINLLRLRRDEGYKIGLSSAAIVTDLLGLPPKNECRATLSGMVIDVNGRMVTCPALVTAGYYKERELPLFNHNFVDTWRNHKTFAQFRKQGLRECQARSFIFSKDINGFDPYGIDAFHKYLQNQKAT